MKENRELIEEIKQIRIQYQSEVSSERKAWPKSIKLRVSQLFEQGLVGTEISKACELPYYTVLKWRPNGPRASRPRKPVQTFKELSVVTDSKVATVTVPTRNDSNAEPISAKSDHELVTVTVTTPEGFKVEVPGIALAAELLRKIMNGGR